MHLHAICLYGTNLHAVFVKPHSFSAIDTGSRRIGL